jgi:hypothetical protein
MYRTRRSLTGIAAAFLLTVPCLAADDWSGLLNRVPDSANAVVLIDAQAILASPIAVKEGWATQQQQNYVQGTATLPPNVQRALFAANLEPGTMHNRWEMGLFVTKAAVSMPMLAKLEEGSLDTVADQSVVLAPKRNVYFAELAPNTIGAMFPANRQELGRWLRTAKKGSSAGLSSYLTAAARKGTPIVMAIDMTDTLDEKQVAIYLGKAAALKNKNVDAAQLAKLITGLRGVTLSVKFDNAIQAELAVDFSDSPQAFSAVLKPLLLETLGNFGCMVDSLTSAEGTVSGKSFVMRGPFTATEMRRLLTLVHPPTPSVDTAIAGEAPSASTDPVIIASKRYYSEVDRILNDLELKRKTIENEKQWNMWHDKYADEIDRLPITKVDPELLQYGADLSGKLRTISASVKGVKIKATAMESYKRSSWDVYGGYYSNSSDVDSMKAEERAKGQLDRLEIWKSIENDQAAMRKKMVGKYKIDF